MTLKRRRASHAARCHKWPLGAFAKLIDSAQSQNGVWIDVRVSPRKEPFFTVRDRGDGLSRAQLLSRVAVPSPVREWLRGDTYACPWQAAAFRLGADVTILSKTSDACYAALLSRERIADLRHPESQSPNVLLQWDHSISETNPHAAALCTYSPWQTARQISDVFHSIAPTGTLVAISSLKRDLQQAELELDLDTDPHDIRLSALPNKEHNHFISSIRLSHSLRSYLQLLYLEPTFRIYLRDRVVRERRLSASMFGRHDFVYNYTPGAISGSNSTPTTKKLVFHLGFDHGAHENEYGMLLYHKRRLIKPYLKLGFQIQPRNQIRVVAIVEADHLVPNSNMQSFEEDDAYQDLIFALGQSLKMFWAPYGSMTNAYRIHCNDPMPKWVRCDVCARWRQLSTNTPHPSDTSCAQWTCDMNTGGTDECNQPDDVCHQKVPVTVLERRPISPISPSKECRKRPRSATSRLESPMKRPRHSGAADSALVNIEPVRDKMMLGTTSPIPNLQSPIGFDSCTPEMGASDGAELRTDPFSLNESDSPLSRSTSSPGNMLEKAAKAKPLPSTVPHADPELKGLEAPVLPSESVKHVGINNLRWRDGSKPCDISKAASESNDHLREPLRRPQQSDASLRDDHQNIENQASASKSNFLEDSQKRTSIKEQSSDDGNEPNHAVVSESRPRSRNAGASRPPRPEAVRHGRPVTVPLVREVVVHHSAQFVDINNRNSTIKVFPETEQRVAGDVLLTSTDGDVPAVSEHPQPFEGQPATKAFAVQTSSADPCPGDDPDLVEHAETQGNDRLECDSVEVPIGRDKEEEAIKLLLNLRSQEYDVKSGVEKVPNTLLQAPSITDVDPDRNYDAKELAELNPESKLEHGVRARIEDCPQTSRDIPDPFGDKSKPVTPATNLLQTPTRGAKAIPPRCFPSQFSSVPGMLSPNTANPLLDVTTEDVLVGSTLNGIDVSKDFLDLSDIDIGLKTPSQQKHILKCGTPQNSQSQLRKRQPHVPPQFSFDAFPAGTVSRLNPANDRRNQTAYVNRRASDSERQSQQRPQCDAGEKITSSNPLGLGEITNPGEGGECLPNGTGARHSSDGGQIRRCIGRNEGADELGNNGSQGIMNHGSIRISDISSMIPWSQIAATAAAAGAVAAAATARDSGMSNQLRTQERHSSDCSPGVRISQEEMEKLKEELQDQRKLTETYKEKLQELICALAPAIAGQMTKLIKTPIEIDVHQLSKDIISTVTEKAKEDASREQLQAIESCKASEQIACSSLERLRGLVRSFLEEAVGLTTQSEQDKPVDRHFEEYLNALDVFPP
eukprot:TRINITY_DN396_c0_g1_i1.p1 TRINITY_DN396_c0_g1~~TRINITY_DN396_c0_g1_i1.p1  ORF type:complete len:1305 (+),score=201.90 TRINITY_DN396_c0_g1_i1:261-4175(+)